MATVVFFPEGAYGPTNNCVGIGQVLVERGHRVVFVIEESFAGSLEAQGFEERLMRLGPPPEVEEEPGQFWKDFIRDTASSSSRHGGRCATAAATSTIACARSSTRSSRT